MLDTLTVAKLKIIAKNQFTTQYDGDCTSTNYPTGFHKMKKAELIKLIRDHREHIATRGLAEIKPKVVEDKTPYHPVLQARDFKKEQEEELARNLKEKQERLDKVEKDSAMINTAMLDAIAHHFQGKGLVAYDVAFPAKLIATCMTLVNLFDDGNDVIIQAKLGDQLTRMFEKMRDNVRDRALDLKAELEAEERATNNTEINMNVIEKLNSDIDRCRQQWAILNNAFVICKDQVRPKILGQTGMNWGQYTTLEEMAKINKRKANDRRLTLDTLLNNRDEFDKRLSNRHEDFGLVTIPDGL